MKRLFAFFLGLLLSFCSFAVQADELDLSPQGIENTEDVEIVQEIIEVPNTETKQMTEEEINELLGEDPYLGQTSWLGAKVEKKTKTKTPFPTLLNHQ